MSHRSFRAQPVTCHSERSEESALRFCGSGSRLEPADPSPCCAGLRMTGFACHSERSEESASFSGCPCSPRRAGSLPRSARLKIANAGPALPRGSPFRRRRSGGPTSQVGGRWRSAHPSARLAPPSPLGGPRAAPPARPRALPPKPPRSGRQSRPPLAPLLAPEKPDARFPCPPPPAQERRPHIFRGGPAGATGPGCGGLDMSLTVFHSTERTFGREAAWRFRKAATHQPKRS
ncbi:MAG: hypothetical protein KatS3mg007_0463 [Thermoanaerobaculum sp.]|nr:MAG: hypothetical protein KatS3mg007_0463 [Thermoanaerobaculum sp.]